jgi:septal ring factor EnvC (AmiA/AmiB activator)
MKIKQYQVWVKSCLFHLTFGFLTEAKTAKEAIERTQAFVDANIPQHPAIAKKAKIADERFLEIAANHPKSVIPYSQILTAILFAILSPLAAFSQSVECPPSLICLTQAEANAAAQNARELIATREKITVLESALKSKDDTIREIQETAKKNENDLKEAINRTTAELARTNGQLTGAEAMNVRLTAIIDFMLKNGRTKKYGVINF